MKPTKNYGLSDSLIDAVRKSVEEAKLHPNQQKLDVHEPEKDELTSQDFKKLRAGKKVKDDIDTKPKLKEDEQIDELSRGTLKSYVKKANKSAQHYSFEPAVRDPKSGNQYRPTFTKRSKGIDLAKDKIKREEYEQIDEASHGYKLKLTKTTHPKDVTDDQDEPVKATEKHYEVHQNDKKVGNILHHYNDYGGHFYDADLHGKKVPYDRSKGGEGAHNFLKSVVNTKFHSNLKKEEYEMMDEVKLADLPRRKVVGKSYGADYVDPEGADETAADMKKAEPKRKSGPQGTMKRRFIKDKSKLRMQYK